MKSKIGKISLVLLSLFLIAYAGYQAWNFFYDPYKTEIAMRYTVNESMRVKGIAVRSEELIFSDEAGSVSYILEDATKVLKNTAVAYMHASVDTVSNSLLVENIEHEIELLKEANSTVNQVYGAAELLNQQIGDALVSMADSSKNNTVQEMPVHRDQLLLLLNKKQILTGKVENFNDRIEMLENQRAFLKEKISADYEKSVAATKSGYFVSGADGYEELINKDSLFEMSAEHIEALINEELTYEGEAIGKIADDYTWYYVVSVPPDEAEAFVVGRQLTAAFDGISDNEIPLTVKEIITDETSENLIIVFSCTEFTSELASIRQTGAELLFTSISGLRISEQAVRFDEKQQRGVYVLDRGTVRFKSIDILYDGVGYKLCRWNQGVAGTLQLFDEIFVEGTDLSVGKVIE